MYVVFGPFTVPVAVSSGASIHDPARVHIHGTWRKPEPRPCFPAFASRGASSFVWFFPILAQERCYGSPLAFSLCTRTRPGRREASVSRSASCSGPSTPMCSSDPTLPAAICPLARPSHRRMHLDHQARSPSHSHTSTPSLTPSLPGRGKGGIAKGLCHYPTGSFETGLGKRRAPPCAVRSCSTAQIWLLMELHSGWADTSHIAAGNSLVSDGGSICDRVPFFRSRCIVFLRKGWRLQ